MYQIIANKELAPKVKLLEISVPEIAKKTKPGQFVIFRLDEKGERIPLTIANRNIEKGTVTVVFHEVGNSTKRLGRLKKGSTVLDVAGPLGNPAELTRGSRVLCIGGDIWVAPLHFLASVLREEKNQIVTVVGARTKEHLIFENEMKEISDQLFVSTDDGSKGNKGLDFLQDVLKTQKFDRVIAMGPVVMMQKVVEFTRPLGLKTLVTLAPIMMDGMGMCGVCRVSVDGETKFACMDGPEFDGHQVDFELLIRRQRMYLPEERISSMLHEQQGGANLE